MMGIPMGSGEGQVKKLNLSFEVSLLIVSLACQFVRSRFEATGCIVLGADHVILTEHRSFLLTYQYV
jgi:hypothetical protein